MLTVLHTKKDSNKVYEAKSVEYFQREHVFHKGTEIERTQPPSEFITSPETTDGCGMHIYEGTVYVMNSSGKTVATFEIWPAPPADGEGDAKLVIDDEELPQR